MSYRDFIFRPEPPPVPDHPEYEHIGWSCATYHIHGRLYAYPECVNCYACYKIKEILK